MKQIFIQIRSPHKNPLRKSPPFHLSRLCRGIEPDESIPAVRRVYYVDMLKRGAHFEHCSRGLDYFILHGFCGYYHKNQMANLRRIFEYIEL